MFAKNVIHCGNKLQGDFGTDVVLESNCHHNYKTLQSSEYVIRGAAKFQLQLIITLRHFYEHYNEQELIYFVYVRFVKNRKDDKLNYKMVFSSNSLRIKEKMFNNDEGHWHMICENTRNQIRSFDVTVELDILSNVSSFAALHEDTEFTDFELRAEDGLVRVHKALLAASSPVLKRMLEGEWKETTEGAVNIPGMSAATLQHFKDYIYLETLPNTGLEELILLSSCYMMPILEQKCAFQLVTSMTSQTASELLEFSMKHKLSQLKWAILDYLQCGGVKVDDMRVNELDANLPNVDQAK